MPSHGSAGVWSYKARGSNRSCVWLCRPRRRAWRQFSYLMDFQMRSTETFLPNFPLPSILMAMPFPLSRCGSAICRTKLRSPPLPPCSEASFSRRVGPAWFPPLAARLAQTTCLCSVGLLPGLLAQCLPRLVYESGHRLGEMFQNHSPLLEVAFAILC